MLTMVNNDAVLVRFNGSAWLFKDPKNAALFMAKRDGATSKPVGSCLYHMQAADAVPTVARGDFVRLPCAAS